MDDQRRVRCLVVDDDRDGATVLGDFLEVLGADVRVVYGGAEAIAIASEFKPQMVVLDINMPMVDGFETSSELHRQAWSNAATFIAYTGLPHPKSALTAAGFDYVVSKGDGPDLFEVVLRRLRPELRS